MTKRLTNDYVLETFELDRDWQNYLRDNQSTLRILHSGSMYGLNENVLNKIGYKKSVDFIVWLKKNTYEQIEKIIIHENKL